MTIMAQDSRGSPMGFMGYPARGADGGNGPELRSVRLVCPGLISVIMNVIVASQFLFTG